MISTAASMHTFFTTCHPSGAKKGFINSEALTLSRTNSSIKTFEENLTAFKKHLMEGGYPQNFVNNTPSEVKFQQRTQVLPQRNKTKKDLALHHTIPPNSSKSQGNLTKKWFLKQKKPLLNKICKEPPMISYRKGRSLKDILVRAKI